ncbi:hypothetical protein CPB85DRAFT_247931 [Mucidula mucida]|nr:hypothetical protein CPB85DRAFT_247931 [Mucidula mucida]
MNRNHFSSKATCPSVDAHLCPPYLTRKTCATSLGQWFHRRRVINASTRTSRDSFDAREDAKRVLSTEKAKLNIFSGRVSFFKAYLGGCLPPVEDTRRCIACFLDDPPSDSRSLESRSSASPSTKAKKYKGSVLEDPTSYYRHSSSLFRSLCSPPSSSLSS